MPAAIFSASSASVTTPRWPGNGGDARLRRKCLRGDLVPHRFDGGGRWSDEDNPGRFESAREGGVLRQEAVAWMDGGRARLARCRHDPFDRKIALRSRRRAYRHGLIGHIDVQGVAVRLRIDRDGRDTHPARCPDDPAGDLAPVGDQNFPEHPASSPLKV